MEEETVEEGVVKVGGGERHFLEETMANCKRYSVTMAPLKEGSFQSKRATLGPRHWTRGALGVSGAPAPLT